jgi:methylated-DNA-[protein]-cysteine S-methyltransferase
MGCKLLVTPIGNLSITWTKKGILRIRIGRGRRIGNPPAFVEKLLKVLKEYFSGKRVSFEGIPLDFSSVNKFFKDVYQAVSKIKYGHTATYKQIAKMVGCKNVARAVGLALRKNPLPIVIPCHRVIYSTGRTGKYIFGRKAKQILLAIEAKTCQCPKI